VGFLLRKSKGALGIAAAVLVVSAGCRGNRYSAILGEVFDSAGVRVVRYDLTGVSIPTYGVLGARDLDLGAQNGPPEYTFSRVTNLAVAEDRSIVVSDAVAREIRVFSADGAYQGSVGRGGEGPCEFAAAPVIADLSRDTLFTFDGRARRISTFLTSGQLVSEASLPDDDIGPTTSLLRLDDGSYLSQSNWVNPATANAVYDMRLELDSIVIEHLDADATVIDTLRLLGDRNRAPR
jgi:hypothetical protein